MKALEKIINLIKRRRLAKAFSVNFRWGLRRAKAFLRQKGLAQKLWGSYAKRLYFMLFFMAAFWGLLYGCGRVDMAYFNEEAVLVRRLTGSDFDAKDPFAMALHSFGASNRIQVTLKTAQPRQFSFRRVDLDQGNMNLVLTLKDGRKIEYILHNPNIDNFESGAVDQFTLALPAGLSAFDIEGFELVLSPDVQGIYGEWHCREGEISILLGGKRTVIAKKNWKTPFIFSKENPKASLLPVGEENSLYRQIQSIYPDVLAVCQKEKKSVHDNLIKSTALNALSLSNGKTLYLEVETVSLENQTTILQNQLGAVELSEFDQLDYDGTMALRVQFYSDAGGQYEMDFPLDTPGKDDFELGALSVFEVVMPEGLSVFDIWSMELLVQDPHDAWAPRMIRAYLRTDYGVNLELARFTDTTLSAGRGTCVFYEGLIQTEKTPLVFDLTAKYKLPERLAKEIQEVYGTPVTGVAYSMYFNEFDFYGRQRLFYNQVKALYGEEENA